MTRPRTISLIGPAGSGKSTLALSWSARFPEYKKVDDLAPLLEYLRLDRAVVDATCPVELRKKLAAERSEYHYLADRVDEYLAALRAEPGLLPTARFCTPIGAQAMEVDDPMVWDDILVRLARTLDPEGHYLIEYARGHDQAYLRGFGLSEEQVYEHTLSGLLRALPPELRMRSAILHVGADHGTRVARNEARKLKTGQFTPTKVMEEVYRRDVFAQAHDSENEDFRWGLERIGDYLLPVVSIRNEKQRDERELREFFDRAVVRAMELFEIYGGAPMTLA